MNVNENTQILLDEIKSHFMWQNPH